MKKPKVNKIAKRNNVKPTRKFNGKRYKLVDEVEPIAGTPDMFEIRRRAKRDNLSLRFVYNKTNDTGLVYSRKKTNSRKKKR